MVFTGKLSQGCSNCRKVHVKCDERRPECARCVRLNKTCTGSREPLDLIFRNTFPVTNKEANPNRDENKQSTFLPYNGKANESTWIQFSPILAISYDDLALDYFYNITLENLPQADHARYLHLQFSSLYTTSRHDSALRLAALAISHAVYSRDTRNNIRGTQISRKFYGQAILAINAALKDTIEARSDETLYAVLLLCGYETTVCDVQSLSAWASHVDGAIALLSLRGTEDLERPFSRRMYYFIRRSSILSHMQSAQSIGPLFTSLPISQHGDESAEDLLFSKTVHIPQLQSSANDLIMHANLNSDLEIYELISNAQKLDDNLADWVNNLPSSYKYTTAPTLRTPIDGNSSNSDYIPSHFHTYENMFIGRVWNLYRVSRLIVQSIILRAVSWLSERSLQQYHTEFTRSECSIGILVDEICSSVPFLLGFEANIQSSKTPSSPDARWDLWPQNCMKLVNTTMNGKFSLVWPLHIASSVLSAPQIQRDWIKAQLRWLGDAGNIPQASLVATRESQTLLGGAESFRFDCV